MIHVDPESHVSIERNLCVDASGRVLIGVRDRSAIAAALAALADGLSALAPSDPRGDPVRASMRELHANLDRWVANP